MCNVVEEWKCLHGVFLRNLERLLSKISLVGGIHDPLLIKTKNNFLVMMHHEIFKKRCIHRKKPLGVKISGADAVNHVDA